MGTGNLDTDLANHDPADYSAFSMPRDVSDLHREYGSAADEWSSVISMPRAAWSRWVTELYWKPDDLEQVGALLHTFRKASRSAYRKPAYKQVESLREQCNLPDVVDKALALLGACPDKAFADKNLFNVARTDEDELVLDWDDDSGPSITLYLSAAGHVVYICEWSDGLGAKGDDHWDSKHLPILLDALFDRLSRERSGSDNK